MSGVLAAAPAATDLRAIARALSCLGVVLAAHLAVLVLLPAGTRPASSPPTPVTVTLIAPPAEPAPKMVPSAPVAEAMPAAPTPRKIPAVQVPRKMPAAPVPRKMPAAPAVQESRPSKIERTAPPPKPADVRPAQQQTQPAPEARLAPKADARPAHIDPAVPPAPTPAPPATSPSVAASAAASPGREADAVRDPAGSAPAQKLSPPRFDAAYLDNPKPEYPRLARRLGEQGTVLLDVYVGANGLPEKIGLNASSGSPRLDRAARETVRRWKFVPARQGERAVGGWIVVPIRFVLEG